MEVSPRCFASMVARDLSLQHPGGPLLPSTPRDALGNPLGATPPTPRTAAALQQPTGGETLAGEATEMLRRFRAEAEAPPARTPHEDEAINASLTPRQLQLLKGNRTGWTPLDPDYPRRLPRGMSSWGQHDYPIWVEKPAWGEHYARPIRDRIVEHKRWHAAAESKEIEARRTAAARPVLRQRLEVMHDPVYRSPAGGFGSVTIVRDDPLAQPPPLPSQGGGSHGALGALLITIPVVRQGRGNATVGLTIDLNQRLPKEGVWVFAGDLVAWKYKFREMLSSFGDEGGGSAFAKVLLLRGREVEWTPDLKAMSLYDMRDKGFTLQLRQLALRPPSSEGAHRKMSTSQGNSRSSRRGAGDVAGPVGVYDKVQGLDREGKSLSFGAQPLVEDRNVEGEGMSGNVGEDHGKEAAASEPSKFVAAEKASAQGRVVLPGSVQEASSSGELWSLEMGTSRIGASTQGVISILKQEGGASVAARSSGRSVGEGSLRSTSKKMGNSIKTSSTPRRRASDKGGAPSSEGTLRGKNMSQELGGWEASAHSKSPQPIGSPW